PGLQPLTPGYISSRLVQNSISPTPYVSPSKKDYEILFQTLFDEYFSPPPRVVSPDLVVVLLQELLIESVYLRQPPLIKMYHLLVLHQESMNSILSHSSRTLHMYSTKDSRFRGKLLKLLKEEDDENDHRLLLQKE
nr:hypothetical protein [Tanacetum cinerariifolium]